MNAAAWPSIEQEDRPRRFGVTPVIEWAVLLAALLVAAASYLAIKEAAGADRALSPVATAALLVANFVPGVLLLMLLGRRIAMRRAAASPVGGTGRLHVRLVALFSTMAAVPMLLVMVVASLLFQYGVEFWSSARARNMLDNATALVRENINREIERVTRETGTMSEDLAAELQSTPVDSLRFKEYLFYQTTARNLSEALIIRRGDREPIIVLNPYGRPLTNVVSPVIMDRLDRGEPAVTLQSRDRAGAVVSMPGARQTYVYGARVFDEELTNQQRRGDAIVRDYRELQTRSSSLQFRFNAALLAISLIIVGIAVWIALKVADRLVAPVGELVGAARRVASGDLSARVSDPKSRDEVGTLARVFNQMTGQLEQQNAALVAANGQLENRRALIEAVISGVSAGVIATSPGRLVQIANRSAAELLGAGELVGRPLADASPELDALVAGGQREAVVQLGHGLDAVTLAVRIARAPAGPVITFDDISQQLADQRRAAWSDVARRIAHEIKNPLTPIQLAAERLQRRYGAKVGEGDETFARLTDTIVRQVGDLRRMVDEFSSFARMPKPVFRREPLCDLVRQAMFLHEVAHPNVRFDLRCDDPAPELVCDRRQIGQALTNILKNAAEAIEAKGGEGGSIAIDVHRDAGRVLVAVADSGVGLPAERDRIVEPYMTTRARGTGLGLAIVKKIVEEHLGTIGFSDREGGGTVVAMSFDAAALARLDEGEGDDVPTPDATPERT